MKTVITYGTFDMLHVGHIRLLKRARNLGDRLIVALSTDEFNHTKHKTSFMSYEDRKEILEAVQYVDLVIPEHCWEQKVEDVKKYEVDLFVIGDDWKGEFDFLQEHCEVNYLPRTLDVSTTQLKSKLPVL